MSEERVTKAKTEALFHQLLTRTRLETIIEENSDAYDFIVLTTRHLPIVYSELGKANPPKFSIKLISSYASRRPYRQLCIWSTSLNKAGSEKGWVALSKTKIFSSEVKTSKKKRVLAALRTAVKGQTDFVRYSTEYPFLCPLSGKIVKDGTQMHVDHFGDTPFIKIVELWLNLYNFNYEDIALDRKGDLKDPDVFKNWYNFHKDKAILKAVCKTANMKKGARGN